MTAQENRRRHDEMHRSSVAGKLARGALQNQGRETDPLWYGTEQIGFINPGFPG